MQCFMKKKMSYRQRLNVHIMRLPAACPQLQFFPPIPCNISSPQAWISRLAVAQECSWTVKFQWYVYFRVKRKRLSSPFQKKERQLTIGEHNAYCFVQDGFRRMFLWSKLRKMQCFAQGFFARAADWFSFSSDLCIHFYVLEILK